MLGFISPNVQRLPDRIRAKLEQLLHGGRVVGANLQEEQLSRLADLDADNRVAVLLEDPAQLTIWRMASSRADPWGEVAAELMRK